MSILVSFVSLAIQKLGICSCLKARSKLFLWGNTAGYLDLVVLSLNLISINLGYFSGCLGQKFKVLTFPSIQILSVEV